MRHPTESVDALAAQDIRERRERAQRRGHPLATFDELESGGHPPDRNADQEHGRSTAER